MAAVCRSPVLFPAGLAFLPFGDQRELGMKQERKTERGKKRDSGYLSALCLELAIVPITGTAVSCAFRPAVAPRSRACVSRRVTAGRNRGCSAHDTHHCRVARAAGQVPCCCRSAVPRRHCRAGLGHGLDRDPGPDLGRGHGRSRARGTRLACRQRCRVRARHTHHHSRADRPVHPRAR